MSDTGIIKIHGKDYHTVAKRVQDFRRDHPEWGIITMMKPGEGDLVRMSAQINDQSGNVLAMGHAEENRSQGINRTSAIENAETSAVGRALAFLGYAGTEIASADEMESATARQRELEASEYLLKHNEAMRDYLPSIVVIKGALDLDEYSTAKEAWNEIPEDVKQALWVAPSKGGIFTTSERTKMKSNEWGAAHA